MLCYAATSQITDKIYRFGPFVGIKILWNFTTNSAETMYSLLLNNDCTIKFEGTIWYVFVLRKTYMYYQYICKFDQLNLMYCHTSYCKTNDFIKYHTITAIIKFFNYTSIYEEYIWSLLIILVQYIRHYLGHCIVIRILCQLFRFNA